MALYPLAKECTWLKASLLKLLLGSKSPWVVPCFPVCHPLAKFWTVWSQSSPLMSRVRWRAKRSSPEWHVTLSSFPILLITQSSCPDSLKMWLNQRENESLNEVVEEDMGMCLRSWGVTRGRGVKWEEVAVSDRCATSSRCKTVQNWRKSSCKVWQDRK